MDTVRCIGRTAVITKASNFLEWGHGIQNGAGRMEFPDGRVKEGIFENNTFKGPHIGTP